MSPPARGRGSKLVLLLGQHASDPKGRADMLEQARLLASLAESLDIAYLEKRVAEEGADPDMVRHLTIRGE